MRDIIKIYSTISKEKINTLSPSSLDIGELALVREANHERLYCKNASGEITPINRRFDAGEIQFVGKTIQTEWIDPRLAQWAGDVTSMNQVKFFISVTNVPMVSDSYRLTNMTDMFTYCSGLTEIPLLDTSNVTTMTQMFYYCRVLTEIPLLDTSNVTNMSLMFSECSGLTEIPLLDTSNVTDMNGMFSSCTVLTTIPELNTSNVINMSYMFLHCFKLVTCKLKGIKVNLDLKDCYSLNKESILYIMNNSQTLTINSTAWANSGLTDTDPDVVAFKAKGWTLIH